MALMSNEWISLIRRGGGGEGACDRKAATIKSHMKIFHEGNNIESASDMKTAILSSGGVPAVNIAVSGPPDDSEFPIQSSRFRVPQV